MAIMKDGFSTTFTFSLAPSGFTLRMHEQEVTPPGFDGGGSVDWTDMRNTSFRTFSPKTLVTLAECSAVVKYDPLVLEEIFDMINDNQQITVTFPDDTFVTFWGYINSFVPGNNVEGSQPTATITIIPTNVNDSDEETEPTWPT